MDNRRLWIFKHLEEMGEIDEIDVEEISWIPPRKFTTENDGESIVIRGDPDSRYVNEDSDDEDSDEEDDEDESDCSYNDSTEYSDDDYYYY
ncbi:hypothetical protein ACJMK2_040574 [Sinanodonta woodiana]|uniref:Uncharacterized protein n=1 Tax=Sinanodonta woodiana TaxID=1069815 RepID=A0ABD3W1E9_SINWO